MERKGFYLFCTKFEKSILLLIRMLTYAACFATFFLLFSIDNVEIITLSRTAAVTLSTYVIILVLLTGIYGRFDVGTRKDKQIIFSLVLAHVLTDLITYLELSIMKTNENNNTTFKLENLGILLLVMVLQTLIVYVGAKAGSTFYFHINGAQKCLIVTSDLKEAQRVSAALKDFEQRYVLQAIVSYDDPDLEAHMVAADTIFLYEVPLTKRTEIVDFSYQNLKNIYFNPHIADILEQNSKPVAVDDISFFASEFHLITFEQRIIKRLSDILLSSLALILTSPILLVSAIAIKRYDHGRVFFKQKRATVHGRIFEIYKFRTMCENAGTYSATDHDERVTRPGRFLRKYRIDELPQFFNILKGDMSLVGPRPEMIENVENYTKELPEFRYRLRMKAGLTGYAQIIGKYNTSSKDKLMLDLMYIENFSILNDIRLLFQTVLVLFKAEDSTEAFKAEDTERDEAGTDED